MATGIADGVQKIRDKLGKPQSWYDQQNRDNPWEGLPDDWDEEAYLELNPDVAQEIEQGKIASAEDHYRTWGRFEPREWSLSDPEPEEDEEEVPLPEEGTGTAQIVPGAPQGPHEMNIVDYAGQVATNPSLGMTLDNPETEQNESMFLEDHLQDIDENAEGTNIDPNDPRYDMDPGALEQDTWQGEAETVDPVDPRDAAGYEAALTEGKMEGAEMEAAEGELSEGSLIDAPQIDLESIGSGLNPDGSVNEVGQALKEYAELDLNDVDPKATVKGQLEILQSEFVGPNGEPRIPAWAAASARNVQKIAAFKGMTGTAATAALSQAIMEASIGVAQSDAQFFQTLTLENLNHKQEATINRANILARMEEFNADARLTAAIQNSKAFLEMDMKNLDNQQQANLVNAQARIQSILEDAKAINTARMFNAQSENEMQMFYETLNSNIKMFSAAQVNDMTKFNVGEANAMNKFNAELENGRQKFYQEMQYAIDLANAKWRQEVTMKEADQQFEAAATDVKNMLGLSVEQLNQLWDRSDALLDYIWKSTENELDRKNAMAISQLNAQTQLKMADKQASGQKAAGWGSIFGSIAGSIAGSDKFLDWLF